MQPNDIPISSEDRQWTEGKPRLIAHLRNERASGLAQAKRDWFLRTHGRLTCEKCGMDPVEVYGGLHGTACIEVRGAVPLPGVVVMLRAVVVVAGAACAVGSRIAMLDAGVLVAMPRRKAATGVVRTVTASRGVQKGRADDVTQCE